MNLAPAQHRETWSGWPWLPAANSLLNFFKSNLMIYFFWIFVDVISFCVQCLPSIFHTWTTLANAVTNINDPSCAWDLTNLSQPLITAKCVTHPVYLHASQCVHSACTFLFFISRIANSRIHLLLFSCSMCRITVLGAVLFICFVKTWRIFSNLYQCKYLTILYILYHYFMLFNTAPYAVWWGDLLDFTLFSISLWPIIGFQIMTREISYVSGWKCHEM